MINKETLTPVKQVAKHVETKDSSSQLQLYANYHKLYQVIAIK